MVRGRVNGEVAGNVSPTVPLCATLDQLWTTTEGQSLPTESDWISGERPSRVACGAVSFSDSS